jgi:hypothetical protein
MMPAQMCLTFVVLALAISVVRNERPSMGECGKTIGCWGTADFVVQYELGDVRALFTIARPHTSGSTAYVAVALSTDQTMEDDDTVACIIDGSDSVSLWKGFNGFHSNAPYAAGNSQFTEETLDFSNGWVSCTYLRPIVVDGDSNFFDLSRSYFMFVAVAVPNDPATGGLGYHATNKYISSSAVDLSVAANLTSAVIEPLPLIKAHASFMATAWFIIIPIVTLLPKLKTLGIMKVKLVGRELWFLIHFVGQITSLLLLIGGFLMAFGALEWRFIAGPHTILGVIVLGVLVIQIIVGLIRPKPDSKIRIAFNIFHIGLGSLLQLAAMLCVVFGALFIDDTFGRNKTSAWLWLFIVSAIMIVVAQVMGRALPMLLKKKLEEAEGADKRNKEIVLAVVVFGVMLVPVVFTILLIINVIDPYM